MPAIRILILFILVSKISLSQNAYPQNIFRAPMNPPLELSGTFAELRQVNFHSGIDIRVAGRTEKNVYAIGNGYISRIKVEPGGYGKAIYITHPQGYVSVYAHLDQFNKPISALVKSIQYSLQSFSIDIDFPKDSLRVIQGEIIGIAGNTGYSFGPHLHFEIRDAATEEIIDPLLFGLQISDNIPPEFRNLKIYVHGHSTINNENQNKVYKTILLQNKKYSISEIPFISGAVSFGFEISDKQNISNPNNLGLKKLTVYIDDSLFLDISFDKLSFSVTRHQLAYIDLYETRTNKRYFHRTWKKPGNTLPIYQYIRNEGIFTIEENKEYTVRCIALDAAGNKSELSFKMSGINKNVDTEQVCVSDNVLFQRDTLNIWEGRFSKIIFPNGSLFTDECFKINEIESVTSNISPLLSVNNENAPADFYRIAIQPYMEPDYIEKITIAQLKENGQKVGIKTQFTGQFFVAETRSFGNFTLVIDTIPPKITPKNISKEENISKLKVVRFGVTDNICGIKNFNAFINNQWVLLEYDLKSDEMLLIIDENTPSGKFELKIVVTDECGNTAEWEKKLFR